MLFLPELTPGGRKLRIKIKLLLLLFGIFCLGFFVLLYISAQKENIKLAEEKARLEKELKLSRFRAEIKNSSSQQKTQLRKRNLASLEGEVSRSVCQQCFQHYQYQLEVKDEQGRWIFKDDNIFDDIPGNLTLTEHFWQELSDHNPVKKRKNDAYHAPRLKNRIFIGIEPDRSKIEYAYSPLGVGSSKMELNVKFYSSLSMNYSFLLVEVRVGIGLEIRF